jgi:hypothetical protein
MLLLSDVARLDLGEIVHLSACFSALKLKQIGRPVIGQAAQLFNHGPARDP